MAWKTQPAPTESAPLRDGDSELVQRAQEGDDGALHDLVDQYADGLFRLAFSLVGNAPDAEDVVQETFLGAFRRLRGFEGRSSVKTWLTRILVRQAARHHRRRSVRRTVPLDVEGRESGAGVETGPTTAEDVTMRMDVEEALGALSTDHREVVVLREMQGMSYAEIAEVLDLPAGTVESRLFRARQHLKELLKGYMP